MASWTVWWSRAYTGEHLLETWMFSQWLMTELTFPLFQHHHQALWQLSVLYQWNSVSREDLSLDGENKNLCIFNIIYWVLWIILYVHLRNIRFNEGVSFFFQQDFQSFQKQEDLMTHCHFGYLDCWSDFDYLGLVFLFSNDWCEAYNWCDSHTTHNTFTIFNATDSLDVCFIRTTTTSPNLSTINSLSFARHVRIEHMWLCHPFQHSLR